MTLYFLKLSSSDLFGELLDYFKSELPMVGRRHSSDPARERFGKILGSSHENNVESL